MTSEPNSSSASSDSFRDEGLAAFQRQDLPTAQAQLMTAIQHNPQDGLAFLYLGGVYHQMGQHQEALQALHRAAQLLPQQPQVRYNLGIVQEKLGQNAEAYASYQQAVALQPNYPLAQQGMQRLQGAAAPAPVAPSSLYSTPAVPAMPTVPAMPAQAPYQSAPGYAPVAPSAPYALNQPQTVNPAPAYAPAPPSYGQPVATDLAGNPLPAAQPAYAPTPVGAPPGSAYAPPGPAGYQGQQWSPYATEVMTKADSFDLPQAFKDIIRILFSPRSFFEEEEGASGQSAAIAMLLALTIISGTVRLIGGLVSGQSPIFYTIGLVFGLTIGWGLSILFNYLISAVLYGLSRLFGGSGSYTGALRASAYGWAPVTFMSAIAGLIGLVISPTPAPSANTNPFRTSASSSMQPGGFGTPGMRRPGANPFRTQTSASPFATTSSDPTASNPFLQNLMKESARTNNPFSNLLILVGFIWGLVVLGMGLKATQRISAGAAVGVVILQMVVWFVLLVLIGVVLGAAMAGVIAAASSGAH